MPGSSAIHVSGLRELQRDLGRYAKDLKKELSVELKAVAEPVRAAAEQMASANIANIGPTWSRMRVGVTSSLVYVAPKSKRRGGSPRGNLAGLLSEKAMQPALEENEPVIEAALEAMLDRLGEKNGF
jgi:hypothetical protein